MLCCYTPTYDSSCSNRIDPLGESRTVVDQWYAVPILLVSPVRSIHCRRRNRFPNSCFVQCHWVRFFNDDDACEMMLDDWSVKSVSDPRRALSLFKKKAPLKSVFFFGIASHHVVYWSHYSRSAHRIIEYHYIPNIDRKAISVHCRCRSAPNSLFITGRGDLCLE